MFKTSSAFLFEQNDVSLLETGAKSAAVTGGILLGLFWADKSKETNKISAVKRVLDI